MSEKYKTIFYLLTLSDNDGVFKKRREISSQFNPIGIFNPFNLKSFDLANMPSFEVVRSVLLPHGKIHIITLRCINSKLLDFDSLYKYDRDPWIPRNPELAVEWIIRRVKLQEAEVASLKAKPPQHKL